VGTARYHFGVESEMTTKNGAAVGIYAGAGETDAAYPWADPTSKLKDIT